MARSKKAQAAVEGALDLPVAEGQVGLGVDIVEIERMRRILARTPSFKDRVFSEAERAYCDGKTSPETHYATRFAAKEAVVKSLGTGFSRGVGVRDIEVRRTSKGRPYVVLTGRAREVAREQGVREIPLSLSFTHTEAVAFAMAITDDAVSAAKKRVDPMEELAAQFKEARALLDELPASGDAGDDVAAGEAGASVAGVVSASGEAGAGAHVVASGAAVEAEAATSSAEATERPSCVEQTSLL
ncbi:MAG: holo-ACP synthase [Eggerthellaceae bacterium]|nr:holo-ACP synthase [Eggerthellaceae bacterium]